MKIEAGKPYLMPVSQGIVPGQRVAKYEDITAMTALYLTDKDTLASLLPPLFEVPDEPIVSIMCASFGNVDFIPDGGYSIFGVNLSAVFNGKKDNLTGSYCYVLWEDNMLAIQTGREILGVPKTFGEIRGPDQEGNAWQGQVLENDQLLGEVSINNAVESAPEAVKMIEQIGNATPWMTWKFIPSVNWQGSDVSKPVIVPTRTTVHQAFAGEPKVQFHPVSYQHSPTGHQFMQVLESLKVKEYRAGVVTRATQDLLVGEARVLE